MKSAPAKAKADTNYGIWIIVLIAMFFATGLFQNLEIEPGMPLWAE